MTRRVAIGIPVGQAVKHPLADTRFKAMPQRRVRCRLEGQDLTEPVADRENPVLYMIIT
jgi:hypothetical protein